MYRRKYMKWHENASINAVVICAESGEESMPSVLLPLRSNKPSLGACNSERLRWRHDINIHGEKLSFSEGNRSRKLTWKWFLCEWRRLAILPGKIFHLPFLQVLSQQKASFFFIFSMVQLPPHQQCYTNGRMHHEVQDWMNRTPSSWVPWYSMRKLFPFSLGEAIKLLLMLHLSVLGYKTFVCFRCHGSWKIFLGNDTITLKPYLKENICDLARSLSWLHFNLTGGSFPNISVSTGIHTHTHTHTCTTLATKEFGAQGWAGGGRQQWGKKASPAIPDGRHPWNKGIFTQKPTMLVLNSCQPAASVWTKLSSAIFQPPPWTLALPAVKWTSCLRPEPRILNLALKEALTGLVSGITLQP